MQKKQNIQVKRIIKKTSSSAFRHTICRKSILETDVTNYIRSLSIPVHLQGYTLIRDAVLTFLNSPDETSFRTKALYMYLAQKYNLSVTSVERNIRYAKEIALTSCNDDVLTKFFGNSTYLKDGNLSNAEFIATIVDNIRFYR